MVTSDRSVRLLDFGVAKLLVDAAPLEGGLTQVLGLAVTPDYASPEQVSNRPITVSTDVYSLGVVLYEMLTEVRPYRLPRSGMAALEEAILAADVPQASTRVSGRLSRELRGDLDNVLDKALQKDPAQRYPSVESMAADVQRYLDGEPVLARARGRLYRAGKFVNRHRWPFAAAASVLVASTGGTGVALWQAHEARRQEAIARQNLSIFEASSEFSQEVIMEGLRREESASLNTLVDRTVATAENSFGGNPTLSAVAVDAASSWLMTAARASDAEKLLARALLTFPPGFQPTFVGYLRCKHGEALVGVGRHAEGVRELQMGLAANLGAEGSGAYCLQGLADASRQVNDPRAALDFMLRAQQAFANERRQSPSAHAYLLTGLGVALSLSGRTDDADASFAGALELLSGARRDQSSLA
ncbi:protein kinase, partial [Nostoc sp. NIES-2111]